MDPAVRRPSFPAGYGISTDAEGILSWEWARRRLAEARNYWVCTTSPDGAPHARPVWGAWTDDGLCFGTNPASRKARNLAHDPRVTVHLESGDEVVILEGRVEPLPPGLVDEVVRGYERKYAWRPETVGDGWILVRPARGYAWLERGFPASATRFDF